jgi:hypothetical protein
MADNDTKIRITAVDEVTKTLNSISNATKGLTGDFGKLGGALGALGVTGALAGIGAMVKGAIDAAASMGDLSQKTGIAVKELTALDYAMRREGVSTEAFAKGIKELSKNLIEAGDATSKAGKLLTALGVSATAGPREALLKIADAFETLPDGATKATLATQLFGKAGTDLIPALNNGSKGIREIEAEARRLGITFGGDTAKAAKEFSDNVFALQESAKSLGVELVETLLPGLTNISRAMKAAAEDGGILKAAFVGLGGVLAELFNLNGNDLSNTQKRVRELGDEITKLSEVKVKDLGGGLFDRAAFIQAQERIKALREEIAYLNRVAGAVADAQAGKFRDQNDRRAAQGRDLSLGRRLDSIMGDNGTAKAKEEVDTLGQALEALRLKTLSAANGLSGDFAKSLATLSSSLLQGRISIGEYAEIYQALIQQQPFFKAGLERQAAAAKLANDEAELAMRLDEQLLASKNNAIRSLREYAEDLDFERTLLGKSNAEREKSIALRKLEKAGIDTTSAAVQGYVNRIRDEIQAQEDLRNQANVWDEVASRGANFFADLAENGRDAFKSLRASLKDFLRELIATFAKKWILQLGAGLTGSASLAAQAAATGEGSLIGAAGNLIGSGITSATGFAFTGAGLSQGFGLAASNIGAAGYFGGLGANAALAGSSLSAGSIGTAVGAMMPYLLPLLAVGALAYAFRDKGENWRGRIGFGDGASAYTTDGVFGREGFQYIAGNDATNRSIQAFMASTKPLDQQLAAGLTPEQIAAISGSLAAYNASGARRADGQPAEFAFGKGDDTAAQQLTLEYLQQKYGAVFDQIDTTFATFIRDYTGKSEDLLREIGAFAAVLDGLRAMDINGLDVEGLRGFQRAGETLEQTFQRIGGSWQQFEQLFTTDAERFEAAQQSIAKAFAALGISIPSTKDEFESLVRGLDLSTTAGREAFEALMAIAPAFAAVADAATASWRELQGIINEYKPAQTLSGAAAEFQAANPWAAALTTAQLVSQFLTITEEDYGQYSAANQQLIRDILRLGRSANSASDSLDDVTFSGVYGLTADQLARNRLIEEANRLAAALKGARASVADYLAGLSTGRHSLLDPQQQLKVAVDRLYQGFAAAKRGDINAINSLPGLADLVLELARNVYASGPGFGDLFAWVQGLLGEVANPEAAAANFNTKVLEQGDQHLKVAEGTLAMLLNIRDHGNKNAGYIITTVADGSRKVADAIAGLAPSR